jgi:hypothetical protein
VERLRVVALDREPSGQVAICGLSHRSREGLSARLERVRKSFRLAFGFAGALSLRLYILDATLERGPHRVERLVKPADLVVCFRFEIDIKIPVF